MATMSTMVALLNAKCPSSSSVTAAPKSTALKQHLPLSLPRRLLAVPQLLSVSNTPSAAALAGTVFVALATSDSAFAAQQIADMAESSGGDSRGLALLLPIVPAVLWVLYNILQPALNQLNRMRAEKAVVAALGLGAAALAGLAAPPSASAAGEVVMVADAASSSDSRGLLLLFVVAPAILWVLYNILQPALNQINKMRSG